MNDKPLPALALDAWEATLHTLHLWLQIAGKIRMSLFPKSNHWWHVTLYVSCRGSAPDPFLLKIDCSRSSLTSSSID